MDHPAASATPPTNVSSHPPPEPTPRAEPPVDANRCPLSKLAASAVPTPTSAPPPLNNGHPLPSPTPTSTPLTFSGRPSSQLMANSTAAPINNTPPPYSGHPKQATGAIALPSSATPALNSGRPPPTRTPSATRNPTSAAAHLQRQRPAPPIRQTAAARRQNRRQTSIPARAYD